MLMTNYGACPPLRYREIELVLEVTPEELKTLFRIMNDPQIAPLIRGDLLLRGADVFGEIFARWERDGEFGNRFFIKHEKRGLIGFCWEYKRMVLDGNTHISVCLRPDMIGSGCGCLAAALFAEFLFTTLRVEGLYCEVYQFNEPVVKALRSLERYIGHDVAEGIIPGRKYWNGQQWNLHVFRITRNDWQAIRPRLLR
jgi:RimJ/RimL family protein N-acetyltransferase